MVCCLFFNVLEAGIHRLQGDAEQSVKFGSKVGSPRFIRCCLPRHGNDSCWVKMEFQEYNVGGREGRGLKEIYRNHCCRYNYEKKSSDILKTGNLTLGLSATNSWKAHSREMTLPTALLNATQTWGLLGRMSSWTKVVTFCACKLGRKHVKAVSNCITKIERNYLKKSFISNCTSTSFQP